MNSMKDTRRQCCIRRTGRGREIEGGDAAIADRGHAGVFVVGIEGKITAAMGRNANV